MQPIPHALNDRLQWQPHYEGAHLGDWKEVFPRITPEALHRRFEVAAGPGNTARLLMQPSYNLDTHPPTIRAVYFKLYHNRPFDYQEQPNTITFVIEKNDCRINFAKFDKSDMGKSIAKRYLSEAVELAKSTGSKTASLQADLDVGGYAWVRYGFYPKSEHEWYELGKKIMKKIVPHQGGHAIKFNGIKPITENEYRAITGIISSTEILHPDKQDSVQQNCWHLLELERPLGKMGGRELTVAKALLMDTKWEGKLDLDESRHSYRRFKAYTDLGKTQRIAIGA